MREETIITLKQFEVYENVRQSGTVNMYDNQSVSQLSRGQLTEDQAGYITNNYKKLMSIYPDVRK